MAGNLTAMIASIFSGSAVSTDPYFNYTTLLLSTTATNGQQNNTFQDSSTNNFPITRNPATGPNAPTQGTFSPFSQTGWGNYFDGSGDYLTIADNAALRIGTQDFWIEAWVYVTSFASVNTIAIKRVYNATGTGTWFFGIDTNGAVDFDQIQTGATIITTNNNAISLNTWTHVAVSRDSSDIWRIFINGNSSGTTSPTNNFDFSTTEPLVIGNVRDSSNISFNGYISNLRFGIGSPNYTSNFIPSTTPLTNITNTQLLTCQSNRFIDNSTNNFTITPAGNTSVVAFSPFNPTASWSAATYGGSGYFDGSGDYLSATGNAATQMGTGAFTWECWCYILGTSSYQGFIDTRTSPSSGSATGMGLFLNTGTLTPIAATTGTILTSSINVTANSWNHVALTRSSGGTLTIWVNGSSGGTVSNSSNLTDTSIWVGGNSSSPYPAYVNGYLSNVRMTKGADLYTTPFTPPTSPLTTTVSSGTVGLLLNFTNAGIYDATAKNVLETVGSAQVSNTSSQWPSTSMLFNGTTDYLQVNTASDLYNLSSGNWTIEAWVYRTSTATNKSGIITYLDNQSVSINGWAFDCGVTSAGQLGFYSYNSGSTTTTITSSAGAVPINTWTYVAARCVGTAITLYINGASVASGTRGTIANNANCRLRIGSWNYPIAARYWQGYIQDPRITKGYARTITTPTQAFPVQ